MAHYQVKALFAYSVVFDCVADSEEQARQIVEDELLLFDPAQHKPEFDHILDSNTWITWISK